jgi:hypothetical protein
MNKIETVVFTDWMEMMTHLCDKGPLLQFQVAFTQGDIEEGIPDEWYLNVVNAGEGLEEV